jgi:hypothetical protein
MLYWGIGKVIIDNSAYGKGFVENLARDVRNIHIFPITNGLNPHKKYYKLNPHKKYYIMCSNTKTVLRVVDSENFCFDVWPQSRSCSWPLRGEV